MCESDNTKQRKKPLLSWPPRPQSPRPAWNGTNAPLPPCGPPTVFQGRWTCCSFLSKN